MPSLEKWEILLSPGEWGYRLDLEELQAGGGHSLRLGLFTSLQVRPSLPCARRPVCKGAARSQFTPGTTLP